jgi:hypothetical protein
MEGLARRRLQYLELGKVVAGVINTDSADVVVRLVVEDVLRISGRFRGKQ